MHLVHTYNSSMHTNDRRKARVIFFFSLPVFYSTRFCCPLSNLLANQPEWEDSSKGLHFPAEATRYLPFLQRRGPWPFPRCQTS